MKKNVLLAGISLLALSACHRPYALYQPTPYVRLTPAPMPTQLLSVPAPVDSLPDPDEAPSPREAVVASTNTGLAESVANRLIARHQRVTQWTRTTPPVLGGIQPTSEQPKPRPRTSAPSHKKSLREMLGLKPRPALNWWQRIQWQLKASVIVILVAVVFAILGITILAILFGVIGAYLLVRGLKKSFKVRRPWF